MSIEEALEWMSSRLKFNIRPGLSRVEALLDLLDHPERKLSMIHIAGTNGKGSTVAFTRSIFMAAGLKVASFTSPAIEQFGERMSINAAPIPDKKLIYYVELIKPLVEQLDTDEKHAGVTEFEIITAMAFKYFSDEKVDLAVIEVGLGGLLDSTNVIIPVVSGITTIGLDHVDILGATIQEIAAQKAGIIKQGIPVVTGNIVPEALEVILNTAQKKESQIYQLRKDYQGIMREGEGFDFLNSDLKIKNIQKSLLGLHQIENAVMAIELSVVYAHQLGIPLTESAIREGIEQTFWPARMERISSEKPVVLLDGAHNVHAMNRLLENLASEFSGKRLAIIFSAITTKDIPEMIHLLQGVDNSRLIITQFKHPKTLQVEDFRNLENDALNQAKLASDDKIQRVPSWQLAYVRMKADPVNDIILFTGSLYFMAEVRQLLKKELNPKVNFKNFYKQNSE